MLCSQLRSPANPAERRWVQHSKFFNRSWVEFKVSFNDSNGNYWVGNDLLSELKLNGCYKLRFDLQSRSNTSNW